jgi:hypothetical protein
MSKYVRDDKKFRAQVASLADAGLTFPTAPAKLPEYPLHFDGQHCSLFRERPCNECAQPANFNGVPSYVTMHEPQQYEIAPKGKLPEFVAGFVSGLLVLALPVAALILVLWRMR